MTKEATIIDTRELSKYIDNKKLIKVTGLYVSKHLETNEEELIIGINGLKGKIKSKDLEIQQEANKRINDYVGKTFYAVVNSIDNNIIYCSRKEAQIQILKHKIEVGDNLQAKISKLYDYGALITLHDDMISTFIKNDDLMQKGMKISEVYNVGDNISVVVKQVNNNKVLVESIEKYNVDRKEYLRNIEDGDIISGYITRLQVDKIFVKIAPGIDVLCTSENGYRTNDTVDIEIIKSQLENNTLRGKIINLNKINDYISRLQVGKVVNGVVKKIIDNEYYVKISTCVYVKCDLNKNSKISIGDNIKVKISNINTETKQISGLYVDDKKLNEILEKVNEGDIIGGIIKSKNDSIYTVITNTGLRVTCKNINPDLDIDDYVFIEISYINESDLSIWATIIDSNKTEEYLQKRSIGEELNGTIMKIKEHIYIVRISVGVNMVCSISRNIKIDKGDIVKVKLSEIDTDLRILKGEIIDNITKSQSEVDGNKVEDLKDYKRPFVIYGFDKPDMMNKNKRYNKNAIEEMLINGRISERDKSIVRFLMDCRFASANQIQRFLSNNSEISAPNKTNLNNRLKKLIEYRVINGFRLKDGKMMIYCLDVGGKQILDKEYNKKSKDWIQNDVNKGWNIIGKALVSTEIYVRAKDKYLDNNIEFDASPYIHGDKTSKGSKQVVFNMRLKNKDNKLNLLGEVYRKDDVEHAFDKRMGGIEEYLANDLWRTDFKEYGRPKVVIVVESEERLLWVTEKLNSSYPNVIKDYIITTDSRLDEDIFEL